MKTNLLFLIILAALCGAASAQDPVNIGSRRELFLDNLMVNRLEGGAQRVFHHPVAREVVMKFDKPWEGNACGDGVVFRDGDIYRMYYRAMDTSKQPGFTCYAESRDGIHWNRPDLGLVEFQGSKTNNIVLQTAGFHDGNLMVFRDENPSATPDALYKAVSGRVGPGNWSTADKDLAVWKSPDGIHWTMAQKEGVLLNDGNFDSEINKGTIPVLVDFWAPWCGPCRMIAPVLDKIADAMVGKAVVAKVNVDEAPGVASRFRVSSIPTLLFFKNGEVNGQIVGLQSEADLTAKLTALM